MYLLITVLAIHFWLCISDIMHVHCHNLLTNYKICENTKQGIQHDHLGEHRIFCTYKQLICTHRYC